MKAQSRIYGEIRIGRSPCLLPAGLFGQMKDRLAILGSLGRMIFFGLREPGWR